VSKLIAIAACVLMIFFTVEADAKGRSSAGRVNYGGGKHTTSHGGTYIGGSGTSHKGGRYISPTGKNLYGTHK